MEPLFEGDALDAIIVEQPEGLVLEIEDERVALNDPHLTGVLHGHKARLERQASRTAQDIEELRNGITLNRRIDELIDFLNDFDTPRTQYVWLVRFDEDYVRLASEVERVTGRNPYLEPGIRSLSAAARYAGRVAFERLELRFPRYAEKLSGQLSSHVLEGS